VSPEQDGSIDRTLRQSEDALAISRDLSLPKDISQHEKAPKIPGYVLTAPIGKGAYAQVWKAWQVRTGKMVAVKVFSQSGGANWLNLQREVERIVRLDKHPNVVSLLDADLGGAVPYYVMELMEAGSLEKHVNREKPVEVKKAVQWMEEIASALAYVHAKGVIHCDLKPANVLEDESGHARVVDFGQARALTDSSGALGTLFYMAPEQAQIPKEGEIAQPDVRWDIYALGATVYALLTGKAPHGDTMRARLETSPALEERLKIYRELTQKAAAPSLVAEKKVRVDEDLAAIVGKCLEAVPEKRYGSVGAVQADLRARRETRPVGPLAGNRRYRMKKFIRRNAAVVAAVGAIMILLASALAQTVYKQIEVRRQLEYSLKARARQMAEKGDAGGAALCYAELNRMKPSHFARANALFFLRRVVTPAALWRFPGRMTGGWLSPDHKTAVVWRGAEARLYSVETGQPMGKTLAHAGAVDFTDYTPDGKMLVTISSGTVWFWDVQSGEISGKPLLHNDDVKGIGFSPNGKTAITLCKGGKAYWWDVVGRKRKGQPVPSYYHNSRKNKPIFSADGKTVIFWAGTQAIYVYDVITRNMLGQLSAAPKDITVMEISPDGRLIAISDAKGETRLWDIQSRKYTGVPIITDGQGFTIAFSPDGKRVATGGGDGRIRFWSVPSCERKWEMDVLDNGSWIYQLAFSSDGRSLLAYSQGPIIRIWDVATTGVAVGTLSTQADVYSADFNGDGSRLVAVCSDAIRIWDVARRKESARWSVEGGVERVIFSQDCRRVAQLFRDGMIKVCDSLTGCVIATLKGHTQRAVSASFVGNSGRLASISSDGTIRIWDVSSGHEVNKAISFNGELDSVQFSSDGSNLALHCKGQDHIALHDMVGWTGASTTLFQGPEARLLEFSPHGRWGVAGMGVNIWLRDPRTGGSSHGPIPITGQGGVMAWSMDDTWLVVVPVENTLQLWNAESGKAFGELIRPAGKIWPIAFSPDSSKLATGTIDGIVQVWDARNGKPGLPQMRYPGWISTVAFSPDGRSLLSACGDGGGYLFDLRSGRQRLVVRSLGELCGAAFSPDGETMVTATYFLKIYLWDVRTGEPLGLPFESPGGTERTGFSPDGKLLISQPLWGGWGGVFDVRWITEYIGPEVLVGRVQAATGRWMAKSGAIESIPETGMKRLVTLWGGK